VGLKLAAGVAFEEHAPQGATGAPLLLVHGAGGTHLHWPEALRRLPGRRVIAVDLPGHGASPPPGERAILAYARRLVDLLDDLGIDRAAVGGHSMGGAIAVTLALEAPDRIEGLLLVGTGARLRVVPAIVLASADPDRSREVANATAAFSFGAGASPELLRAFAEGMAAVAHGVVHGDFTACDAFDVMERLGAIRAPARIVVGAEDRLTPPKYSIFLRANLPGNGLLVVPGAGHMVTWEAPDAVTGEGALLLAGIS
jgi:pimeloyl-ACP methyl ester carboxylesterase